jgi:predicted RNA-binding Zn ribbon-like protein
LDFLATARLRRGEITDSLQTSDDLKQWLRGPDLPLPAGGITPDDLSTARELRTAIDNVARALKSHGPAPQDVRRINVAAQHPTPVFLLKANGREQSSVAQPDLASTLSVIARDAIALFTRGDLGRLHECARPGCQTLFFDRSPTGQRRWCSMKGCGEVVASASYRRRQLQAGK